MKTALPDSSVVGRVSAGGTNRVTRTANATAAGVTPTTYFVPHLFLFDFRDGRGRRPIAHPAFRCSGCKAWLPAPFESGYQNCTCPDCHAWHGFLMP